MTRKLLYGKTIGMLAVILIFFMPVGHAQEEKMNAGGQWRYVLEDGGATITGYVEKPGGDFVVPSELDGYAVSGIGARAFEKLNITSVTIPDSVKCIGDFAFFECARLSEITIPAGVTRMD